MSGDGDRRDEPLLVWNGIVARVPALVIRAGSLQEVGAALGFAHDHGLRVRVEGDGEDSRRAAAERAVTLDVSSAADP